MAGAGVSGGDSFDRGRLDKDYLCSEIDPGEFEELVAEIIREWGWSARVVGGSGDKGIDIVAECELPIPVIAGIQCKQFAEDNKVGADVVREYDSITEGREDVRHVVIATSSEFTGPARIAAEKRNVNLLNGDQILGALKIMREG